uniref:thialysine N-epsilon-acetyltransferase-like n=1 Tax=Styela clava TaxID=7725 RepID=UPI001939EC8A|nr:thialysine N-epsilon-acetyltransferase-like [Styela clava]
MEFTYSIRKATEKDAKDIFLMLKDLAEYQSLMDQCNLTFERFYKDGFVEDPAFHCIIAESKTATGGVQTVGYALYYYAYSSFNGRSAFLEDIYVKEPHRKRGIGSDLMKNVVNIAKDRGCTQCRFSCRGSNTNALNFYNSMGANDFTDSEDWHSLSLKFDNLL